MEGGSWPDCAKTFLSRYGDNWGGGEGNGKGKKNERKVDDSR